MVKLGVKKVKRLTIWDGGSTIIRDSFYVLFFTSAIYVFDQMLPKGVSHVQRKGDKIACNMCCSFDLLKLDEGHLIQKHVGPKPVAIEDERRNARAICMTAMQH